MSVAGEPSEDCAAAWVETEVPDGATAEVTLVNQCEGAQVGALDALAALNHPPELQSLTYAPSKFVFECEELTLCVSATDADGDPLEYEWRDSSDAVVGTSDCLTVSQANAGSTGYSVRIYDLLDNGDRIEDYLQANYDPAAESHDALVFPVYVNSIDAGGYCEGGDGAYYPIPDALEAGLHTVVLDPACTPSVAAELCCGDGVVYNGQNGTPNAGEECEPGDEGCGGDCVAIPTIDNWSFHPTQVSLVTGIEVVDHDAAWFGQTNGSLTFWNGVSYIEFNLQHNAGFGSMSHVGGMWSPGPHEVFAQAWGGLTFHWVNPFSPAQPVNVSQVASGWTQFAGASAPGSIRDVWGVPGDNTRLWSVTHQGYLSRQDLDHFTATAVPVHIRTAPATDFASISGVDPNNIYIAGTGGVLEHCDGEVVGSCVSLAGSLPGAMNGTTARLVARATSTSDIWVADGTSGHVAHYDGSTWALVHTAPGGVLSLWANHATDVWIGTDTNQIIQRFNGSSWTTEHTGGAGIVSQLEGTDDALRIFGHQFAPGTNIMQGNP